jgi:hypothetical protein
METPPNAHCAKKDIQLPKPNGKTWISELTLK